MDDNSDITFQRCPHDKENPYLIISRNLIRDKSISPECRWLIIYLLSHAEGWKVNPQQIMNHLKGHKGCGRDRIYAIINEAIEAGYMKKQDIVKKNLLNGCIYYVSENPKFKKSLRHPERQDTGSQDTENTDYKNKQSSNEDKKEHIEEKEEEKSGNSDNFYQYPKDTPPSILEIPTKETLTKEKKEKAKQKDAYSADASTLALLLISKIKEKKSNFTYDKPPTSWLKASEKLLKIRTKQEIGKLIIFAINHEFWFSKCLSPEKLLKHLDALELEMTKPQGARKSQSPVTRMEENRAFAKTIEGKFPQSVRNGDIYIGPDYIEFKCAGAYTTADYHLKFTEPSFRDRVMNNLKKFKLPTQGL